MLSAEIISALIKCINDWIKPGLNRYLIVGAVDGKESSHLRGQISLIPLRACVFLIYPSPHQ